MEHIYFNNCPKIFNPKLTIKEVKEILRDKTGIKEENQQIQAHFDLNTVYDFKKDNEYFWYNFDLRIYDKTRFYTKIKKSFYETEVILDLTKKIKELKQMVFEQTNIPIDRQQFFIDKIDDKKKLDNDESVIKYNLFKYDLYININENFNDTLYIKYPNSDIKKIQTDLCLLGIELLEKLPNTIKYGCALYNIYYKDKLSPLFNLLVDSGIKPGEMIELKNRNTFRIYIKTLIGKTFPVNVEPNDTILLIKIFLYIRERIPSNEYSFIFAGNLLRDNRTVADYNITNESTIHLVFKLKGGNNK